MRVIVNAILIILVTHILLDNLKFHQTFDIRPLLNINTKYKRRENFSTLNPKEELLNYLKKTSVPNTTPESIDNLRLNNYMKKKELLKNDLQMELGESVKEGNYYTSQFNTPNLANNVTDTPDFYNNHLIGQYDGKKINETLQISSQKQQDVSIIDQYSKQPCFFDENTKTIKPDMWKYKDEIPMNGGLMGNVTGYDMMEDDYGIYDDNNMSLQSCLPPMKEDMHYGDDMRTGMGLPNQQNRDAGFT